MKTATQGRVFMMALYSLWDMVQMVPPGECLKCAMKVAHSFIALVDIRREWNLETYGNKTDDY